MLPVNGMYTSRHYTYEVVPVQRGVAMPLVELRDALTRQTTCTTCDVRRSSSSAWPAQRMISSTSIARRSSYSAWPAQRRSWSTSDARRSSYSAWPAQRRSWSTCDARRTSSPAEPGGGKAGNRRDAHAGGNRKNCRDSKKFFSFGC